ncbi:hypothetical protein ACJRO7_006836 [Eucalyptus globulus]|uniref:BHLH domain-containing protein n=1 Tax=Eucalyptus globulus TaxID=34317 RepID=A0ABD3IMM0_EUCGL
MALPLVNVIGKEMERGLRPLSPRRTERDIIEKNRRNRKKHLYSVLYSLLEVKSLTKRIDEAIRYIKGLETAEKEKRPSPSTSSNASTAIKSPQIEIRVRDSSLEVILTSGLHDQFIFLEILWMPNEKKVKVPNANFSAAVNSVYHLVNAMISESGLGTVMISERLKTFVNGSTAEEFHPKLWDCGLSPNVWNF